MSRGEERAVDVRTVGRLLVRGTRRAAVTLIGFSLVVLGLAGLLLPVLPGWGLVIAGLVVLSREYSWAYGALAFTRRHAASSSAKVRSLAGRVRRRPAGLRPSAEVVIDLTRPEDPPADEAADGVTPAEGPLRRSERSA